MAIKKIKFDDNNNGHIPATALREMSLLQELKHQNIVNLIQIINLENDAL